MVLANPTHVRPIPIAPSLTKVFFGSMEFGFREGAPPAALQKRTRVFLLYEQSASPSKQTISHGDFRKGFFQRMDTQITTLTECGRHTCSMLLLLNFLTGQP
jgi:hypothetical protein